MHTHTHTYLMVLCLTRVMPRSFKLEVSGNLNTTISGFKIALAATLHEVTNNKLSGASDPSLQSNDRLGISAFHFESRVGNRNPLSASHTS